MDLEGIAGIDAQIAQLEKELTGLYHKRVILLEAEIHHSRVRMGEFGSETSVPEPSKPETASFRAPATKRVTRKGAKTKRARIQAPSPAKEESAPVQEARVVNLETAPAPEPASPSQAQKTAARKAKQPKKRTRTPTAEVEKNILDVLKDAGRSGLSHAEVSKMTGLGYQTVVQKLRGLPGIEKQGTGRQGRFSLKG